MVAIFILYGYPTLGVAVLKDNLFFARQLILDFRIRGNGQGLRGIFRIRGEAPAVRCSTKHQLFLPSITRAVRPIAFNFSPSATSRASLVVFRHVAFASASSALSVSTLCRSRHNWQSFEHSPLSAASSCSMRSIMVICFFLGIFPVVTASAAR